MAQTTADGKFTYLAQKLNPAAATITVTSNLGINSGSIFLQNDQQTEWIRFTSNTASGSYWVLGGLTRDIDQVAIPIVSNSTGKTWLANQKCLLVYMHDQYFDASQGGTINGPVTFTGAVSLTGSFKVPTFLNAAARDAAIPVPANGMEAYLITEGYFSDYAAGMWGQRSTGTSTVNASTTVAGKVEIATQSEFDAGTSTGSTGALLSATPDVIQISNMSQYAAGEALSVNDFVTLEIQRGFAFNANSGGTTSLSMGIDAARTRQSVDIIGNGVSFSSMNLSLAKVLAPADNIVIRIETDSAGNPSGTLANANATASITGASLSTTLTDTLVTFGGSFTLTNNTLYHIVFQRVTAVDAANYYIIGGYTWNTRGFMTNQYNGTTWGTAGGTVFLYLNGTGFYKTLAVKTNATNQSNSNFIGPNNTTVARGSIANIRRDGTFKTFTGLTENTYYYLSNTPGSIATSPGTIKTIVGISESTTALKVYSDIKITASIQTVGSSATGVSQAYEGDGKPLTITLGAGNGASGGTAAVDMSFDGITFQSLKIVTTLSASVGSTFTVTGKGFYRFTLSGAVSNFNFIF